MVCHSMGFDQRHSNLHWNITPLVPDWNLQKRKFDWNLQKRIQTLRELTKVCNLPLKHNIPVSFFITHLVVQRHPSLPRASSSLAGKEGSSGTSL